MRTCDDDVELITVMVSLLCSCEMLSAGTDGTLRLFNFALESQNREMSQKPILKKLGIQKRNQRLPPIEGELHEN